MTALLLLLSLMVSGTLSYISFYFGITTLVETVIAGLLGTVALEFSILLWQLNRLAIKNNSELTGLQRYLEKAELAEETHEVFASMEKDFLDVQAAKHGPKDLFVSHLKTEIEGLRAKLADAARRNEMRIRSDYIINVEGVFDSLGVSNDKSVRVTYPVDSGEPWVGGASDQRFFEVLIDQVKNGKVSTLDVLFLVDDLTEPETNTVYGVCGWLNKQTRISSKIGKQSEFEKVCSLNSLDPNFIDFGIYGPEMLFRTTSAGADHEGIYSKDPQLVDRYASVFKEFWNSSTLCMKPDASLALSTNKSLSEICRITHSQVPLLSKESDE